MDILYYFAYGSNMNIEQMESRCPYSKRVSNGFIDGYQRIISHYSEKWKGGVYSIEPKNKSIVHGVLYEITPFDLKSLDIYEGYPRIYDRVYLPVNVIGGSFDKIKKINAITYISNIKDESVKISSRYKKICDIGYLSTELQSTNNL